MIQDLFAALSAALTQSLWLALASAFVWGILSILLSPCHLSSIPLVIGFAMQQEKKTVASAFGFSLVFSLGILISIALIGITTAAIGHLMGDLGLIGNIIVVVIFFVVGLHLLDVIQLNWPSVLKGTKKGGLTAAC